MIKWHINKSVYSRDKIDNLKELFADVLKYKEKIKNIWTEEWMYLDEYEKLLKRLEYGRETQY